jgi:5-methylcytosine-specific restriction endonuclease McrA
VKTILPKQPRVRLEPELYQRLREQVLRRDSWRCQSCGTRSSLEVHHKELRSQSGNDSEQNLITLCVACHSLVHGGTRPPG